MKRTSDHRTIYCNFDATKLLQTKINTYTNPFARRKLFSKDVTGRTKYLHILGNKCYKSKLLLRIQLLAEKEQLNEEDRNTINIIDKSLTKFMLEAKQKSGQIPVAWSPTLKLHYNLKIYWQLQLSLLKFPRNIEDSLFKHKSVIEELIQENPPDNPKDEIYNLDDLSHLKKKNKKTKQVLKNIVSNARKLQREHLVDRQLKHSKNKKKKDETAVIKIINSEQQNHDFKTIEMYTKQIEQGDMKYIEVPENPNDNPKDPTTKWKRLEDVNNINNALTEWNRTHFQQAQGTPFTVPPLSNELGHSGMNKTGNQILENDYTPTQPMRASVRRLINNMYQQCDEIEETEVTRDDMKSAFKKWRESTSTSPSGRHLGHMKSILTEVKDDEDWPISTIKPLEIFKIRKKEREIYFILYLITVPSRVAIWDIFILEYPSHY